MNKKLKLDFASKTEAGYHNQVNEDAVFAFANTSAKDVRGLFIVADGIAVHGEIASQLTIETIHQELRSFLESTAEDSTKIVEAYATDLRQLLQQAVEKANDFVSAKSQEFEVKGKSASTVVCLLILNKLAVIANVGNSRAYQFRDGKLDQITKDHSLVSRLLEEGKVISPEEADRYKFIIHSAIGQSNPQIDIFNRTLERGDRILLCSDGIWKTLSNEELSDYLNTNNSTDEILKRFFVNSPYHRDDVTAILIDVK